jgi:predicted small integral membrane protein
MTIRVSKALLLFALGFYYALVVFNNTNDYNSNLTFVRHVLLMDTTYPGNHGMWRAIHAPAVPFMFFVSIVCWEIVTGILLWWAGIRLIRNLHASAAVFNAAKKLGVIALTLSLLMWL